MTPLVRARGSEIGLRTDAIPHLRSTLGIFDLRLASELIFNGDAGNTAPGRPSQRTGVELANFYTPNNWLTIDADAGYSSAHFSDVCTPDQAAIGNCGPGDEIPGALQTVYAAGMTVDSPRSALFASLRYRYFGSRPLVEDNSVRSHGEGIVNAQLGYRMSPKTRLKLDVFNLFNSEARDIDYYYASSLPGDPPSTFPSNGGSGVNDIHFHPTVPRTVRISFSTGI